MTTRRIPIAKFGQELRSIASLKVSSALNDRSRATFVIPESEDPPLDYLAELQVIFDKQAENILFTGYVDSAEPHGANTTIKAISAPEFDERMTGSFRRWNVSAVDAIYAVVREIGFTDDRLRLDGIDSLPIELFEVIVPVAGLELENSLRIGDVSLTPAEWTQTGSPAVGASFNHLNLESYSCVAIAMETASKMYDAERAALARIDIALDGLLASTVYGLSVKPDGLAIPFARSIALARPRRLMAACVYGLGSDRLWVRETGPHIASSTVHAGLMNRRWRDLQLSLPPAELRNALAALRRAADESQSPVQRGQALWDTVEFLVAGVKVPHTFEKFELSKISQALKDISLTEKQRTRLNDVLNKLNEPSLAMKMKDRAAADGVPLTDSEIKLLNNVRKARNASAHGKPPLYVSDHDLRWAVSIVSRLLIYRWHSILNDNGQQ